MLKSIQFGAVTRFDLGRTILGQGRYWSSAYLIDNLMIDTGCAHSANELVHALRDTSIDLILNTHSHEDHIGANAVLQQEKDNVRILIHPTGIPVLADPRSQQPLHPYRRIYWGYPQSSLGQPVSDGEEIETELYKFRVIYTPGHSPDHVCFYEASKGWMFTGDLFVGGKERALRVDYDIWEIIVSLKKISQLPISILFPGSARVREDPQDEILSKISYLEEFGERVQHLAQEGWSVPAITRELCGSPMYIEYFTLGHFSRRGLVRSFLHQHSYPSPNQI
jgi:glyoxylase-like metal-dependent hydrolase (beta-lactamase superfamily II)